MIVLNLEAQKAWFSEEAQCKERKKKWEQDPQLRFLDFHRSPRVPKFGPGGRRQQGQPIWG